MWISYFRCKGCGAVRQFGANTGKIPNRDVPEFNRSPVLLCNDGCKGSGTHTTHSFIDSEMLVVGKNEKATEIIAKRCRFLRTIGATNQI